MVRKKIEGDCMASGRCLFQTVTRQMREQVACTLWRNPVSAGWALLALHSGESWNKGLILIGTSKDW